MAWARLDDGFHDHPKVDSLSLAAVGLYTLCLTWAHRHRRTAVVQGHITDARVQKIAGKQSHKLVSELLTSGLWETQDGLAGWVIHDFADYLPKERDPEEAAEAGRKGAAAKWAKRGKELADSQDPASKEPDGSMANDGSRASAPAFPSRPVPSPLVNQEGGDRPETLSESAETELPPNATPGDARCSGHQGVADPGPCRGCRAARLDAERKLEAAMERDAREAEAVARDCEECDGVWVLDANKNPTGKKCTKHRRTA